MVGDALVVDVVRDIERVPEGKVEDEEEGVGGFLGVTVCWCVGVWVCVRTAYVAGLFRGLNPWKA